MSVIEFTQRRWRCPHCRKSWAKRTTATDHIGSGCHMDPDTHTCATCRHYQRGHDGSWEEPPLDPDCRVGVNINNLCKFELPKRCTYWAPQPWAVASCD